MNLGEKEDRRSLLSQPVSVDSDGESEKGPWLPRYLLIGLSALCIGVSYCDRVNLSVAIVEMSNEFGWDIHEKGEVLSGFFYGYVVSQIFGAILSRKFGGHIVLGVGAFGWSLATVLVPLSASYGKTVLLINRIVVGLFEGVAFPVVYYLFALNVPEDERSRSVSVIAVNVSFGAVFAFYLSPILIYRFSWEMVFYFFGSLGLVWVLIWIAFWTFNSNSGFNIANDGCKSPKVRVFRLKAIEKGASKESGESKSLCEMFGDVRKLLNHNVVLAVLWCHFSHNIGHYVVLSWLPTFLDTLGVKGENLSITCIPYIFMAVLATLFGTIADKMIEKKRRMTTSVDKERVICDIRRFWTLTLFMASSTCLVLLTFFISSTATEGETNLFFVIVFLSLALGLNSSCPVAGYESAKLDLIEESKVGILQGLSNSFASLSGVIGVPVVGFIHNVFGSWRPVFVWIAFMFTLAAAVFYKFGKWDQKIII